MGDVRAMTRSDVAGAMDVVRASGQAEERAQGREPAPMPDEAWRQFRRRTERFLERDPQGAFVAVEGDAVVGVAQSIRRSSFWGLSMLFVHPGAQSHGLGRRLLEAALPYSRDADVRMIMASTDPRAVRLYSSAGLAVHPAMSAEGEVDRSAIPTGLAGRAAGAGDLELVASVDESLRGSRAEDVAFLLGQGATLEVVDGGGGRGYVLYQAGRLRMLGATDRRAAEQLLWRFLAGSGPKVELHGLTAGQDWAVRLALAARLRVRPAGPLFVSGMPHPPELWIPSGWYF